MSQTFTKKSAIVIFSIIALFCFFITNKEVFSKKNLEEICQDLVENGQQGLSQEKYREQLKECQRFYEQQVAKLEKEVYETGAKKKSLQNAIYILNKKIKNIEYQIYQSYLVIKDLKVQIKNTESSIEKTSKNIQEAKNKLKAILRAINEEDKKSTIEILFSEKKLSGFFENLVWLARLSDKSKEILQDIKALKRNLEIQKQSLNEEKLGLEHTIQIQKMQKEQNARAKKEKEYYYQLTNQEYLRKLKEKESAEKMAAKIRQKIYELIGVRRKVTYKEAIDVAKYAGSLIGIRPALLLGILSQESAIGRNVGQCYLKNPKTGAGVVASTGKKINRVMHPTRDVPHFLRIIKNINKEKGLNLDPFSTLVSCPMSFGWGGAMGPAQFIPSTWVLYENRVKQKTGVAPDPWDIRDAALAASIYLKDALNRYGTEGAAIQSYFCGSPKNTYWCKWYERNVLYLTKCHQQFIDTGTMSLKCQQDIGLK